MPAVIGVAVLTSVGATTLAASATASYIVGSIIITGALVGVSYATQTLTRAKPQRERQQATLNEAMGPRRFIYGQAMVAGTRAFWEARDGMMYQCLLLAGHEIDGIAEYWIGDRRVNTDGGEAGGNVTDYPMINAVYYERYFGTATQAVASVLHDRFPEVWTAEHRLRGIAHVCVVFAGVKEKIRQTVFPQGAYTQLRFVVRGKKLYDPSLGWMDPENPATWAWGDNSNDVILDYLRSRDGYKRPLAQIDMPSFQDFHARCGEIVYRRDGTPTLRYRTWGTISFDEEPQAALARLCASCDATLYQGPSGKIGIRDGAWTGPLISIPTQHITGVALSQGNDKLDSYNRLKVSYTDPDNYYQPTELTARDDFPSQAAIGVIEETRDFVMVPEWTQAARLAKIAMARENPDWKGSLATDLMPLDALGEKAVQVSFDPLGEGDPLMDAPCMLAGFTLRGDLSGCDLSFASVPASAWTWEPDDEEPPRPITPQVIDRVDVVDAPTDLVTGLLRDPGIRIALSWGEPTRGDLTAEAEYSVAGAGLWLPISVSSDGVSAVTPQLADGGSYDLRVRWVAGSGGNASDWSEAGPLLAVADNVITGPPTGFVANGGVGQVLLAWTAPGQSNLRAVRIYRASAGAPFSSAVAIVTINLSPNQAFDMTDSGLSSGSYDYWARALNASGIGDATSTTGPVTATAS